MTLQKPNFLNLFFLISSLCILIIVYYIEFFLEAEPCRLCTYQRFPYFIIFLLSLSSLLIKNNKFIKITFFFYFLIFFSSLIMATYHFGIENDFWRSLTNCESDFKNFSEKKYLKEYLLNKNYIACSDVSFKILGISLAGYNILISFSLAILSFVGLKKIKN